MKTPSNDHLLSMLYSCRINHTTLPLPLPPPPHPHTNLLPPKRTPLRQPRLPPRRLTQHGRTPPTNHDGLRVREDGRDGEAAGAFYVHEEGAWGGDESLGVLVGGWEKGKGGGKGRYLELVLSRFGGWGWI